MQCNLLTDLEPILRAIGLPYKSRLTLGGIKKRRLVAMLRVKVQLAAWVVWAICDETWPNALPIGYVIRPKSIDDPNRQKPLDVLCMIAV